MHGCQPAHRTAACGFEQGVARRIDGQGGYERAVDETPDQIDRLGRVDGLVRDAARGRVERKTSGEGTESVEHPLLGGGEQAVAPIECGMEGAMTRIGRAARESPQAEAILE